jgi:DNA helicase-2/ATP-dependent DNA helicase PcrA
MPLTTTYRCPKAVVRTANQWVPDIHAHETAPEGEVISLPYDELMATAKPGDAILCRYNKYLVGTCFRFIRAGIPARIEGRAIGQQLAALCKKWKTTKLDTLAARVSSWKTREMGKALAKKQETKATEIEDRAETVFVLIDRAKELGHTTVDQLVR